MAPPSPFTTSSLFMTSTVSRQVLGPRVPVSLRAVRRPSKPAHSVVTPITATAAPPASISSTVQQQRGLASGKTGDMGHDKTHVTDKKASDSKYDIHSSASKSGFADKGTTHGQSETHTGHARSQAAMQKDETNARARAKQEHPAAREPIIGMEDERGSKGH